MFLQMYVKVVVLYTSLNVNNYMGKKLFTENYKFNLDGPKDVSFL